MCGTEGPFIFELKVARAKIRETLRLAKIFKEQRARAKDSLPNGREPLLIPRSKGDGGLGRSVSSGWIKLRGLRGLDRGRSRVAANDAGYFCVVRERSHKPVTF